MSAKEKPPAKKTPSRPLPDLPPGMSRAGSDNPIPVAPWQVAAPPKAVASEDMLLVCLQDPFEGIGASSSKIVDATVPASDHDPRHLWRLESVLEMNLPRFFESWATRGSFTLDLTVAASVRESAGHWGGNARTTSATGNCRVMVMRDGDNKIRFSLGSGARQATETSMPRPDVQRFLNADVAFEANGANGLTAAAVAVISNKSWSRLIAGSAVLTKGLAFDGKWRTNLESGDGDSAAQGTWAFAVMSSADYSALCLNHGWPEHVDG
ncbi:hypothetical protein llg_31070 [Luteolibacter sp. LG18]|nr:hypothetical protein llg_31070 [Luteolibacter sp. LG18]